MALQLHRGQEKCWEKILCTDWLMSLAFNGESCRIFFSAVIESAWLEIREKSTCVQISTVSLTTPTVSWASRGRRCRVELHPWHLVCQLLHCCRWTIMLGEGGMRSWQVPSSRYILLRNSRPENTNRFLVTQGADKEEERVSTTMLENDVNPFMEKNNN